MTAIPSETPTTPSVSVIISTRNRGALVVHAVESVLANDYPTFDLVVVDQSDGDDTASALRALEADPRLRCIRNSRLGAGVGRNTGASESRGDIIAITDDDCEVPRDWVRRIVDAFAVDSRIGLVFGNVHPGIHDATEGFIPSYVRQEPFLARGAFDKIRVEGIGACMAARRSVFDELMGFDEGFGTSGLFPNGEDTDFALRALFAGHFVYETPAVALTHLGFRPWRERDDLARRYWLSTGAAYGKLLKCGEWSALLVLAALGSRWLRRGSPVAESLGFGARNGALMKPFFRGVVAALRVPVDRPTRHFKVGAGGR